MVGPVIFDAVKRYLTYSGYKVTLVVNITDVDDKLIARIATPRHDDGGAGRGDDGRLHAQSRRRWASTRSITFPRATENIDEIIELTQVARRQGLRLRVGRRRLFRRRQGPRVRQAQQPRRVEHARRRGRDGRAQAVAGRLRPVEERQAGRAVVGQPLGQGPAGLAHRVLGHEPHASWAKRSTSTAAGSTWSFRTTKTKSPKANAATASRMAKYWMHNGLMQASSEVGKVGGRDTREPQAPHEPATDQPARRPARSARSKGAAAFPELLKRHAPETIRFFLLSTHYRRPIDFSEERIEEVGTGLEQFYRFFKRYERITGQLLRHSVRHRASRRRLRARRGRYAEGDRRASQSLLGSDGRRFQHWRRGRRFV